MKVIQGAIIMFFGMAIMITLVMLFAKAMDAPTELVYADTRDCVTIYTKDGKKNCSKSLEDFEQVYVMPHWLRQKLDNQ